MSTTLTFLIVGKKATNYNEKRHSVNAITRFLFPGTTLHGFIAKAPPLVTGVSLTGNVKATHRLVYSFVCDAGFKEDMTLYYAFYRLHFWIFQ